MKIQAHLIGNTISTNSEKAYTLAKQNSFGEKIGEKVQYSFQESFFLFEEKKLEILQNKKTLTEQEILKKFTRIDKKFLTKYIVFKDLRKKGYILKTALKFGAEFRVYEKGKKIGDAHAKWLLFTDNEKNKQSWQEIAAKSRVAHSTKKKILLAIVDDEASITYYELNWIKP
jgi:tRNA-intron endonuclease